MNHGPMPAPPDAIELDFGPLPRDLMNDVEDLMSTAEYGKALTDIIRTDLADCRNGGATYPPNHFPDEIWRRVATLINLLDTQIDIVSSLAERVQLARMEALSVSRKVEK